MIQRAATPVGVLLAGGEGRRLGGQKAALMLAGQPLIAYALAAMRAAVPELAIVAKAGTRLPAFDGVPVWIEPDEPRHPLVGIVHALDAARGRPVLVCPADLPFITAAALGELADADPGRAPAVVATGPGGTGTMQPLLGCYRPAAAALLRDAAAAGTAPVRAAVAAIGPRLLPLADAGVLFNVNTPENLCAAQARLGLGDRPHDDGALPEASRPRGRGSL